MKKQVVILILAVVLVSCGWLQAATRYVPSQYSTIQSAINTCVNGDTVIVADGTYTGTGNRDIDYGGRAITVRSENGPETCIIDCQGTEAEPHRGFTFTSVEDENSILEGFTITNGYAVEGGGIYCNNSSPTVTNCLIIGNSAYEGGGMYNLQCDLTVTNCTFTGNSAGHGGGIHSIACDATVTNSVLWGNSDEFAFGPGGYPTITYCNVQGGWSGEGNIDTDPNFVDPDNGNYHLNSTSLCIDAGDNSVITELNDLDSHSRIVDGNCDTTATVDMGAYEFDFTYLGDFEGDDCDVDLGDFGVLANNWQTNNPATDISPYLDPDGVIDLGELMVLALHWLERTP